jgi:hypothetical protein
MEMIFHEYNCRQVAKWEPIIFNELEIVDLLVFTIKLASVKINYCVGNNWVALSLIIYFNGLINNYH